jgi:hypothetical protein
VYRDQVGRRTLESMMDEQVNDVDGRRRFLAGGGFCPPHLHLALEVERQRSGGQTGSAILFRAMLRARLEHLARGLRDPKRRGQAVVDATRPASGCPVCTADELALRDAVARFVEGADTDELWSHWVLRGAYCLQHLELLGTSAASHPTVLERLLEVQIERLTELSDRLEGFIHHASADRIEQQTDAERSAVPEAATTLGGDRRRHA